MADKYLKQSSGPLNEVEATVTSTGVAQAGKIIALGNDGKLDTSLLPSSVGPEIKVVATSENLAAGDLVNIWNDSGTPKARKADASNQRRAVGFVLSAVTSPANASVYCDSMITGLTGLTPGAVYYLSGTTPGAATSTAPTTTNHISQEIGIALSATEISFEPQRPIILA